MTVDYANLEDIQYVTSFIDPYTDNEEHVEYWSEGCSIESLSIYVYYVGKKKPWTYVLRIWSKNTNNFYYYYFNERVWVPLDKKRDILSLSGWAQKVPKDIKQWYKNQILSI